MLKTNHHTQPYPCCCCPVIMLPRYRHIIWVAAWLITKTLLFASFQKHFHVSISVFWCVFWVTNAKHSSAWQNTNTTVSFSPSWEHFTSYSVRENTVRNQEEKWMCWTRTNVLLMEKKNLPPTELKVTCSCPLRSHAALPLERPLSLDRRQETKRQRESVLLDSQQKKKEKKNWNT